MKTAVSSERGGDVTMDITDSRLLIFTWEQSQTAQLQEALETFIAS